MFPFRNPQLSEANAMQNQTIYDDLLRRYRAHFKRDPEVVAYAPGRIEVIGNHTDYNEGYVCSAAINFGTFFAASRRDAGDCRLVAGDLMKEVTFGASCAGPSTDDTWSNYVKGVLAGLRERAPVPSGFDGLFLGNIPLGAGLSSSAALEVSSGLALAQLYGIAVDRLEMARIGQAAEHRFAGVKCGLLDQISSLFGAEEMLVETDFRTFAVKNVPLGEDACFLMCNTHAKHALVDGEYNRRRAACEAARDHFAKVLPHPVRALRDVSLGEWRTHRGGLDDGVARRAAHPIGENERVLAAAGALAAGDLIRFGQLMFESHESSRVNFENSCPELDCLVAAARKIPGVLGARLSGGGFGGSVVVLVHPRDAETAGAALANAYAAAFGKPCDVRLIRPSGGAEVVTET
jgi:galactokinase